MGRAISISMLIFFGSVILFYLLVWLFNDQSGAFSIGIILFLLLSIIITLLIRILESLKKK